MPDNIEEHITTCNETCITVWTQAHVDGDITVTLSNHITDADKTGLHHVFAGTIACPNKRLDVTTSENENILSLPMIGAESASVNIWVDDLKNPETLLIEGTALTT